MICNHIQVTVVLHTHIIWLFPLLYVADNYIKQDKLKCIIYFKPLCNAVVCNFLASFPAAAGFWAEMLQSACDGSIVASPLHLSSRLENCSKNPFPSCDLQNCRLEITEVETWNLILIEVRGGGRRQAWCRALQRHTRAQTVTAGLISNYQGEVTSSALPAIYHQLFLTLQQTGLTPPAG